MSTVGIALLFIGVAFVATLACLDAGRRVGRRAFARPEPSRPAGLGTVEGVAFGLLGLLLAFTFTGAATRFDARRARVVEEANDIGTAWLRLDLLPKEAQPKLREDFRRYADSRIATYGRLAAADAAGAKAEYERSLAIQNEIWAGAVAATRDGGTPAPMLLLPALNAMIDITTTRRSSTELHPPLVIYAVLALVSLGCALLAGYEMGASEAQSWLHVIGYAVVVAFILYVIVDFEYPRLGLIRIEAFDRYLVDVRNAMK
jgi:hypothetical protein